MMALGVTCLGLAAGTALAQEAFVDHGVGAAVAESRGVVCAQDSQGRSLVVACSLDCSPGGWILVTDIDSGETQQVHYPEGVPNSPPFASLMSRNGRFYTCAGATLLEFDLDGRAWTFHGVPAPSEECYTGTALVDGPDGRIYGGSYPHCHLISFDPKTQEMRDYGPLDPAEHYISYLASDSAGWLYAGIGTARCNIVAYHPATGERRQIVAEADRQLGTATVRTGQDGNAYGQAAGRWFRLFGGQGQEIAQADVAPAAPSGAIDWGRTTGVFPDGRKLVRYAIGERYLEVQGPDGGAVRRVALDYISEGAQITSLVAGPDGKAYGSTAHPMHLFAYDPGGPHITDLGPIPRVGGGNFCAMAVQRRQIAGAAYHGGYLYLYDPSRPFNGETGDDPNPRLLAQYEGDITRPRAALAHVDGRHVVMSGFMGYGMRGGGMGIYDLETGESMLLTHEKLIPDQSTICLAALPNGDLIGGTSVETPGGGHPTETEGVLYVLNWATKRVTFRAVPAPGAAEVWALALGPDGMVYGLASGSQLFVFDPAKREVVHRAGLAEYGGLPRHLCLFRAGDGVVILLSKAILRIKPATYEVEKLADSPVAISAGGAIVGNRLYFAAGSHVWSCLLFPNSASEGPSDGRPQR